MMVFSSSLPPLLPQQASHDHRSLAASLVHSFFVVSTFFLTKRFFAQPGKTGFSVLGSFSRIIEAGLKPISAEKSSKKENVEIIQVIDSCLETHSFSPAAKKRPALVI